MNIFAIATVVILFAAVVWLYVELVRYRHELEETRATLEKLEEEMVDLRQYNEELISGEAWRD